MCGYIVYVSKRVCIDGDGNRRARAPFVGLLLCSSAGLPRIPFHGLRFSRMHESSNQNLSYDRHDYALHDSYKYSNTNANALTPTQTSFSRYIHLPVMICISSRRIAHCFALELLSSLYLYRSTLAYCKPLIFSFCIYSIHLQIIYTKSTHCITVYLIFVQIRIYSCTIKEVCALKSRELAAAYTVYSPGATAHS